MSEVITVKITGDNTEFQSVAAKTISTLEKMESRFARPQKAALPILELSPSQLQQMDVAAAKTKELARQAQYAGRGGMAGSMGFLAFSQAVEDAQYGVRGILNNIPQMVLGFGGTMGLAGAISLAAVAAAALYPHLQKLYGVVDDKTVKDAADEWGKIFADGMKAAAAIQEAADAEMRLQNFAAEYNNALAIRLGLQNAMGSYYDEALAAARAERDIAMEILKAREAQVESAGGDSRPLVARRQSMEMTGIDEDLVNRTKEFARAQQELMDLVSRRNNVTAEAADFEKRATEELIRLNQNLAGAKANAAQAESVRKNTTGKEQTNAAISQVASQKVVEKLTEEIALLEASKKVYAEQSTQKLADANAAVTAGDQKINAINQEIKSLQSLKLQREALNRIERENIALAAARKDLESLKKSQTNLQKNADTADEQVSNLDSLIEEIALLQEATGEERKKIESIREEIALRKEAAQLAQATGISEIDARSLLRQRAEVLKKIEEQPTGTIRERREQRSEKRQEERDRKRDERVAEAQRKREERNRKNNKQEDPGIQEKADIDQIRKDAEEKRAKAQEELNENIQKQTTLQERIEKAISAITSA